MTVIPEQNAFNCNFFLDGFDLNGYTLQNVLGFLYIIFQEIVLTKFLDCVQADKCD